MGKTRSGRTGAIRIPHRWNICFLSSGELKIEDHLKTARKRMRAGQEVRAIDIQIGERAYGCFDELHGLPSGKDLSEKFGNLSNIYYGLAGRVYLENITANIEDAKQLANELINDFNTNHASSVAEGQVLRVREKFALVAAGGELATRYGLTNWPIGAASLACSALYKKWIEDRGDLGRSEDRQIIEHVMHFFETNWSARFIDVSDPQSRTPNAAGWKIKVLDGWEFRVYPNVFKQELCKGFSPRQVISVLEDEGLLLIKGKGDSSPTWRPPSGESKRYYRFSPKVLPQIDKEEDQ